MQTLNTDPALSGGHEDAEGTASSPSAVTGADATTQAPDASLAAVNSITGRSFASMDEAKKHYESLNKFVGDQAIAALRDEAKITQGLVGQIMKENPGWSYDDAKRYLLSLQENTRSKAVDTQANQFDPKQAALEARLRDMERETFALKNPDANSYLPKIEEYAKATGKSLHEAYEYLYGDMMKQSRSKEQADALRLEKKGAQVAASSSSPSTPTENAQYAQLMAEYKKTGNAELMQKAIKIKMGLK